MVRPLAILAMLILLVIGPAAAMAATNSAPAPIPAAATPPPAAAAPSPSAPSTPPPPDPLAAIAASQATLTDISNQAAVTSDDAKLAAMGARVAAIEASARTAFAAPAAQLAAIDARIARIEPRRRHAPTAEEVLELAPLMAERAPLAAETGAAQALLTSARNAYNQIAERRREGFSARVLTRSDSPLTPQFWTSLGSAAGSDVARVTSVVDEAVTTAVRADEPRAGIGLGVGLAAALALLFPIRWLALRLSYHPASGGKGKARDAKRPGFTRTGAALWSAAVNAGAPTLAAMALHVGAEWGGVLSSAADDMAAAAVVAVIWAAGILGLGHVLATEPDADRRLLPLDDDEARRLRLPLAIVAAVTGAGFLLTRLNYVAGASVAATIATNCAVSIAYAAAAALVLVSFGRSHELQPDEVSPAAARARAPAWTLISLILTVAIAVTLVAVLAGYSTLAAMTSGQIFWLGLIGASAYLVMRFVDDLVATAFSPQGWASRALFVLFRPRRTTIAQAGALISAAAQVLVIIGALSLAATPFGRGGDLLASHLGQLAGPIRLGSAVISPSAIAAGLFTFVVGVGLARLVQGWVVRRYLPVTDWDAGLRNSVVTGVGYLGVGVAMLCGLAATGLGFAQIALIASALSVGIGFGLQQIVQNFVSGVILLVERPVKVGDWVTVDGSEGNVRRIRVRATEIELFDRSMVIVPNSDLITKPVQNKTLGKHVSRVQLKLAITNAGEVGKVRDLILRIAEARKEVIKDPAPAVFIESLGPAGSVNIACNLYVDDPRAAYRVRSDCYFELLDGLAHYNIGFANVTE